MKKPKWIVGHDAEGNEFVIHTQVPRFVGDLLDDDDGERVEQIEWIDSVDGFTPAALALLMRECGEALADIDDADEARLLEEFDDD